MSVEDLFVGTSESGLHTDHAEVVTFAPCIWYSEKATLFAVGGFSLNRSHSSALKMSWLYTGAAVEDLPTETRQGDQSVTAFAVKIPAKTFNVYLLFIVAIVLNKFVNTTHL